MTWSEKSFLLWLLSLMTLWGICMRTIWPLTRSLMRLNCRYEYFAFTFGYCHPFQCDTFMCFCTTASRQIHLHTLSGPSQRSGRSQETQRRFHWEVLQVLPRWCGKIGSSSRKFVYRHWSSGKQVWLVQYLCPRMHTSRVTTMIRILQFLHSSPHFKKTSLLRVVLSSRSST